MFRCKSCGRKIKKYYYFKSDFVVVVILAERKAFQKQKPFRFMENILSTIIDFISMLVGLLFAFGGLF